jgi:hypothetical protein
MASPLLAALTHFWALGETSGNRANSLGAAPNPFVPSGTITKIAGQIAGGGQADQFGATYGDALLATGASAVDFSGDFSMGLFVRMPNPNPGSVSIFGRGTWYDRFDFVLWSGSGSMSAYLGDGTTSPAVAPFATPISPQPYANNTIVHSTWVWVGVRHVLATKTLTFFLGQAQSGGALRAVNRTYTGTIVDSTLPLRINGLAANASPHHAAIAVQGAFYAPTALTDKNFLALYNLGQGLLPPFTAYPSEGAIPGLTTKARICVVTAPQVLGMGQSWAATGQDTWLTPPLNVTRPTTDLELGFVNARTSFTEGEGVEPAKQATITISAAYFVEGDTASIPLTFGGASSKTLAWGEVAYADPINRVFFPNQNIRVLTYASAAGGILFMPTTMQLTGTSGRRGTGTNTTTNIDPANYTTDRTSYGYGPSFIRGRMVGNAIADRELVARGDSIAAGPGTYLYNLAATNGIPTTQLGVAGMRAATTAIVANDLSGTVLTKASEQVIDQLGVNDVWGNLGYASLLASKTTCWTRWCGSGSQVRKLIATTLTPIATGNAGQTSARASWHTLLRNGTNAELGALTGRPTLVFRWSGSAFVSSGTRSTGAGWPLDLYVIDTAAVCETNHLANDNTWNTVVTAGKIVASAGTISDQIHPIAADAEAMRVLLQPQFDIAVAAELPAIPITDEEDENMEPDAIYVRAVGSSWATDANVVAGDKVRLTPSRRDFNMEYWVVGSTARTGNGVPVPPEGRIVTVPAGGVLQYRCLDGARELVVEVQNV